MTCIAVSGTSTTTLFRSSSRLGEWSTSKSAATTSPISVATSTCSTGGEWGLVLMRRGGLERGMVSHQMWFLKG